MSSPERAALERLLEVAETRIPERGHGYDYADLAEGEPLRHGVVSAQFVVDVCREAIAQPDEVERLRKLIANYLVAVARAPNNRDEAEIDAASRALVEEVRR